MIEKAAEGAKLELEVEEAELETKSDVELGAKVDDEAEVSVLRASMEDNDVVLMEVCSYCARRTQCRFVVRRLEGSRVFQIVKQEQT